MKWLTMAIKCVAAGMLVSVGTVFLLLPGPGLPLIVAGIGLLATEFAWAASLQARMVQWLRQGFELARGFVAGFRLRGKPERVYSPEPAVYSTANGCR